MWSDRENEEFWGEPQERDCSDDEPPEFGCCLPPGECCMPGLHFPSECHTAADYERSHPLDWRCEPSKTPNARLSRDQQP